MKKIFTLLFVVNTTLICAQLQRPMASPLAKVEQRVGLTDLKMEYSRPSKNNREVFGSLVPYDEVWRTGANENAKFTCSDPVVIVKDTLPKGTYALFTKPGKDSWDLIFYSDVSNWGTPDEWKEENVVLKAKVSVKTLTESVESFTISFENLTTKSANLTLAWDKTKVSLPINVPTASKMMTNIDKAMAGPSSADYYAAAEFYFKEKKDMKKALEWATKACELRAEAYWMLRLKSQIQAELGDFKGAVGTAKKSLELAEKDKNKTYIDMNKASIEEWSKK
jgi:tetratricopeptide (TPR) repeat protein